MQHPDAVFVNFAASSAAACLLAPTLLSRLFEPIGDEDQLNVELPETEDTPQDGLLNRIGCRLSFSDSGHLLV